MVRSAWAVLLIIAGCGGAGASEPAPRRADDDRAALIAAMHRYDELARAIDGHGLADMFTADGSLVNAGQTIATTPPEIEKFLASFVGRVRVEATASTVEQVRIEGDRAYLEGHFAQDAVMLGDDTRVHASGKFTGEWVRAGGTWRIHKLETTPDAP